MSDRPFPRYVIECRAHDWVQALPLAAETLTCLRCGHERPLAAPDGTACHPHFVEVGSGWKGRLFDCSTGRYTDQD